MQLGINSYRSNSSKCYEAKQTTNRSEANDAKWFVENYQGLEPLSLEYKDNQDRFLRLWKIDNKLIATVYDSKNKTFTKIESNDIHNSLNTQEQASLLLKRLENSNIVSWVLVLRDGKVYIWPNLKGEAKWTDFIPTDGTTRRTEKAFQNAGSKTLFQAVEVLYKHGFQTSEKGRYVLQNSLGEIIVVPANGNKEIRGYLEGYGGEKTTYSITAVCRNPREGKTPMAGFEYRHPEDRTQTTFHASLLK